MDDARSPDASASARADAAAVSDRLGGRPLWLITLVLAVLSMIGPFTIDTVFPAFDRMGREFGVDVAAMQQVTSIYMLTFALMSIVHGPLSDSLGRRPIMIAGLIGYTLASIACALVDSFALLLVFRALQGACAGAATIVSRVVIRDLFEGPEAQRQMARVMMIFSVAPALAPIVGGWLLGVGSWHIIFWFNAVFALVGITLVLLILPEPLAPAERAPLHLGTTVGSLVGIARSGTIWRIAAASTAGFAAQFLYIVGAPIFVVDLLGLGENDFWMLFVPLITGMMIGAWLSGRLAAGTPRPVLVSRWFRMLLAATLLNVVGIVLVTAGVLPALPFAVLSPGLIALANSVVFPALQLEILDLFPHHRGSAASFGSLIQLLFNAFLAGAIVPLVTGSLLGVALTSMVFAVLAVGLWAWHRRFERRKETAPAIDG